MLEYLKNKQFTGDLSLEDADVLAQYASQSQSILEFGSGGSTQLMAQSSAESITSVETEASWIQLTQERLSQIANARPVEFVGYTTEFNQEFDLIFVDGLWQHRFDFATNVWKYLKPTGVMIFHDTRRDFDFANAVDVAKVFFNEISQIDVNARATNGRSSNMTVLHKKAHEPYVNWNDVEGKPSWAYGIPDGSDHPLWSYK